MHCDISTMLYHNQIVYWFSVFFVVRCFLMDNGWAASEIPGSAGWPTVMHWRLLTAPSQWRPLLKYPGKSAVSAAFFSEHHYWEENLEGLSGGTLPLPLGGAAKSWFLARRTWWQTEKKAGARTGRAVGWGWWRGGEVEGERRWRSWLGSLTDWAAAALLLGAPWKRWELAGIDDW